MGIWEVPRLDGDGGVRRSGGGAGQEILRQRKAPMVVKTRFGGRIAMAVGRSYDDNGGAPPPFEGDLLNCSATGSRRR
jgi:hypothetical protein